MRNLFTKCIPFAIVLVSFCYAQKSVNGIILTEDLEAIQNANIYLEDYTIGSTSDADGYFSLTIPDSLAQKSNLNILIVHVAYDSLKTPLSEALNKKKYILQSKTFEGNQILVKGKSDPISAKELPVSVSLINVKMIESKGFVDAGDLLRVNQSVQVDEKLSGKKTVSIRGGNPENVLILYNGVNINSNYDNIFDLSLISLEDIQRIEILKGSNTSLYGSEALSGVINFVPKINQDHSIRFIQKFGSYNNGDWSLQLNQSFLKKILVSYKQRRSGSQRKYDDENKYIQNESVNQTAHIIYNLSENNKDTSDNIISLYFLQSHLKYDNNLLLEKVNNLNQLITLNYKGAIGPYQMFEISTSYQRLNNIENFILNTAILKRKIENKKSTFLLRKTFNLNSLNFITSYQYDNIELNYFDNREFLSNDSSPIKLIKFKRGKHGLVGLLTFDAKSKDINGLNVSLSYRYDRVDDIQKINELISLASTTSEINSSWDAGMLKASFNITKGFNNVNYIFMFSNGTNVRFPTLLNQLSTPVIFEENPEYVTKLAPEKSRSLETGLTIKNINTFSKSIDSWQINLTYFNNLYENKFRNFYSNFSPFAFYDNIKNAELNGVETNTEINFFNDTFIFEGGLSQYNFSDRAAFPLKSDKKYTANIYFQKWDYDLQVNWFKNSKQIGWLRDLSNELNEHSIPGFSNINLSASKQLKFSQLKFKLFLSAFNILSDKTKFNGLIIHDRRFYFGLEIKY